MIQKSTRYLRLLPAVSLFTLSLLLSGCSSGNSERKLADAADAINAAIEQDLSLDRYEFKISAGTYLNVTQYELQTTAYICVSEDGGRNYYVAGIPSDKTSSFTVEHKIIGDSHYHRIFDKNKGEYHIPADLTSQSAAQTEPPVNGWMLESSGDQKGNESYKGRLWIYNHRISPEDFTEVSRKKEDGKTVITLIRSTEQPGYLPLPLQLVRDERLKWHEQELESPPYTDGNRKYTAETLEAAIDSTGRLLTIEYKLTYETADGTPITTLEDSEINSMTKYNYVNLKRFNDASITIPE